MAHGSSAARSLNRLRKEIMDDNIPGYLTRTDEEQKEATEATKDLTPLQAQLKRQDEDLNVLSTSVKTLRSKLAYATSQPDSVPTDSAGEAIEKETQVPDSQLIVVLKQHNTQLESINRELRTLEGLLDI